MVGRNLLVGDGALLKGPFSHPGQLAKWRPSTGRNKHRATQIPRYMCLAIRSRKVARRLISGKIQTPPA